MSKKAFIGRKLREARMYRGKTIDVLAKETNINKKDIILNILNLFEYKNAVIEIGCIEKNECSFSNNKNT